MYALDPITLAQLPRECVLTATIADKQDPQLRRRHRSERGSYVSRASPEIFW